MREGGSADASSTGAAAAGDATREGLRHQLDEIQAAVSAGHYAKALDLCSETVRERARQRIEAHEAATAFDLELIDQFAELAALQGEVDTADRLYEAYAQFAHRSSNPFVAAIARIEQAMLLADVGRVEDAETRLQVIGPLAAGLDRVEASEKGLDDWAALPCWSELAPRTRPTVLVRFLLARGRILLANGQYAAAQLLLGRALRRAHESNYRLVRAATIPIHIAIARGAMESGDLARAKESLGACRTLVDRSATLGWRVLHAESTAQLSMMTGDLGNAIRVLNELVAVCNASGMRRAILVANMNLAAQLILLNRTTEAADRLAWIRDRAVGGRLDDVRRRAAFMLSVARMRSTSLAEPSVADSVSEQWSAPLEEIMIEKAAEGETVGWLDDIPQTGGFLAWFEEKTLAFRWHVARRDLEAAQCLLASMQSVFGGTDSPLIRTRLREIGGLLDYDRGDYRAAMSAFRAAADDFDRMRLLPELWQALRYLRWCVLRLEGPGPSADSLGQQSNGILERISGSLAASDRVFYLLNKWTSDEESIARQANELLRDQRRAAAMRWPWRLASSRSRVRALDELAATVRVHKRRIADAVTGRGSDHADPLRRRTGWIAALLAHDPRRLTLSYVVLPDRVVVIRRGFLRLAFSIVPVTRIRLRYLVRILHETLQEAQEVGPAMEDAGPIEAERRSRLRSRALQELARILGIDALAAMPRWVTALTFEPDDVLHGLPFGAIACGSGCLAERFASSVAVATPRGSRLAAGSTSKSLIVGMGGGARGVQPLPGVRAELKMVEDLFRAAGVPARMLNDGEAPPDVLFRALRGAKLVHWAGHGSFQPDRPAESGLVLVSPTQERGVLSLLDLCGLDLRTVEHFTLSCCWSADNYVAPGRWVLSLPNALCIAGVHSVLGCLWRVDDARAAAFMRTFYSHLFRASAEKALRAAQLSVIRSVAHESPVVRGATLAAWAGFVLHVPMDAPGGS